jgi:hypothetical protein
MDGIERFGLAAVIAFVVLLAWASSLIHRKSDPTEPAPPALARAGK